MKVNFLVIFIFCALFSFSLRAVEEKNSVIVCENGLEMLNWDLEFLQEAEESVEVLACFFGGEVAQKLLHEIEVRLEKVPKLQVYILASPILLTKKDFKLIQHLQEAFPQNFHMEFSTQVAKLYPDVVSIDNHVKMFVVDETYFSTGGTNLEEKHCTEGLYTPKRDKHTNKEAERLLPAGMRDQDIVGKGPLAHELRTAFYRLYSVWEHYNKTTVLKENPKDFEQSTHYFAVTHRPFVEKFESSNRSRVVEKNQVKMILGGPHQKQNAITNEYMRIIRSAKEEIILAHLYFLLIDPIRNALMDAVNRGVKLTVLTNGISDISPEGAKLFGWGNRMSYVPMFYGSSFHFWDACHVRAMPIKNTRIFEYNVEDVLLHKKMMVVDKKTFVLGSYNFSIKSAYADYELILVFEDEKIAKDALSVYEKDLAYSKKITPQEACAWYFDPFLSYWGELQRKFGGFL